MLIDLLVHHVSVEVLSARWDLSPSCIYHWRHAFLLHGVDSLVYRQSGGRRPKLTPKQKHRLVELIEAGPLVVGCETACWDAVLIRVLIWREFGVLSNRQYVCTLLHNLGFSFQKARFVSDHLDAATRLAWLEQKWPTIVRAAKRRKGLILFEDEASFAQWGSLSYTWARRGRQPEVPTSGKRKGYKVFGAIAYFSGRLFSQGIEGRFNSESYQEFLQMIMAQTTQHLFLIHDGARYHTSASTQAFLAAHRARITAEPLPSYSPEDNPIAYLWKKTKKRATHNQYFKDFAVLTASVDKALAYFAMHPETVLCLFGLYCEESGLGFDHGVGHPLLFLCDAKVPNYRKNKGFKDLGHYSEWPKVADAVIKAAACNSSRPRSFPKANLNIYRPTLGREGAIPREGKAPNRRSQVQPVVCATGRAPMTTGI